MLFCIWPKKEVQADGKLVTMSSSDKGISGMWRGLQVFGAAARGARRRVVPAFPSALRMAARPDDAAEGRDEDGQEEGEQRAPRVHVGLVDPNVLHREGFRRRVTVVSDAACPVLRRALDGVDAPVASRVDEGDFQPFQRFRVAPRRVVHLDPGNAVKAFVERERQPQVVPGRCFGLVGFPTRVRIVGHPDVLGLDEGGDVEARRGGDAEARQLLPVGFHRAPAAGGRVRAQEDTNRVADPIAGGRRDDGKCCGDD